MTAPAASVAPTLGPGSELNVLVVDDDLAHIELLRRNLRRMGANHRIVPFCSGQAALDYVLPEKAPSPTVSAVMLLDINMPGGVDGVEVLRRIKADPLRRHLPIVMLTSTDDQREIDRCYQLGCNAYITKPAASNAFADTAIRLAQFIEITRLPRDHLE